ncbi:uncharacterized protein LOC132704660 [Cylas formicarius]|uniref:uncharacterized protein LOC132704660 n=1 Tax=Cylas formicarius TaxID=197179 RepID=UPI00295855AA|nr:uncharacterized protein LOC132704660 [Cylas formicarius]
MGKNNTGLENSPNGNDEVAPNNSLTIPSEEETDSETEAEHEFDIGNYMPIPCDSISDEEQTNSDASDIELGTIQLPEPYSLSAIEPAGVSVSRDVWSYPPPKESDIELSDSKIDEVKQVMQSVLLPPTAVPEWAKNIPEEKWKEHLINKIQNKEKG